MSSAHLLKSEVGVVTGGGRGIGAAIAERFAQEGANLILTARSEDQLLEVANSCKAKGASSCETHSVDLSQAENVEGFAKTVLSKHKQVDVLVNNAAMDSPGEYSPLEADIALWQKILMLNTLAPMILTHFSYFSTGMAERKHGLIINIGSIAGLSPMPGIAAYATTKWGLRGWSLSCYEADHEYLPQEQQVLVLATECYQIIWGEGGSLLPLLGMNWRRHVPYYNQRLQDLLVCVLGGPIKLDVDLDQAVKTAIREKEAAAKVDAKDKVDQLLQYWELYLSDSTAFRAAVDRKIDWLEQKISRLRSSQGEQDPKDQAEPTTSWFQQIWNVVGSYGKRERLRRIKLAMQDLRETTDQQVAVLAMEVHVADELSSLEVKLQ